MAGQTPPFDVNVAPHIKARLYPDENRTEKRAFAGIQMWDALERAALKTEILNGDDRPFVFFDVGANVGFYALFVHAYLKEANRAARVIAIEPGLVSCARLETNIAASQADIQIIRAAISDTPGSGFLSSKTSNLGEAKLVPGGQNVEPVVIDTLARICGANGLTYIDGMKIDIEGHDFKALKGFFEDAPTSLHPTLLIAETRRKEEAKPLVELCLGQDYLIQEQTRQNTIFKKRPHV